MELNTKVARNAMGVAKNAIKTGDWVYLKKDPSKTTLVVDEVRASGQFRVTDIPGAWFTEKDVEVVKKSANATKDAFGNPIRVGDKVQFATGTFRGIEGKVKKIGNRGGKVTATVTTQEYGDIEEPLAIIKVANSAPVSANASFKVGDRVIFWVFDEKLTGKVKSIRGNKIEVVSGGEKAGITFSEKDLKHWNPSYNSQFASKVAPNAMGLNDKWIDDFHVIVTAEMPDPALVDALKKKAAAWKAYKRNFSDKAADEAHEKAKHDVATVAKRLGAKLEQIGAVLRVVMPNAVVNNDSAELLGKLNKMLKHSAVSVAAGGNPSAKDVIHFKYRGKPYYVGKDEAHMIKQFEDAGLITRAANAAVSSKVARNAMGRDKQDAASVETWIAAFRNTIDDAFPKFKDKIKAEALGEKVIKEIESRIQSEGGKAQLAKEGWTIPKLREALKKALEKVGTKVSTNATIACNASFKVGDRVQLKGGNRTGKIVGGLGAYDKDSYPDCVTVRWDSYGFDVPVKPENLTVANSTLSSKVAKRAINWNYRNKYQFFCVDPSLAKPCILSGWDYKEDAKEDAQELKELKIPYKIVSRRFLEQSGVDPNNGDWWKKNR